MSDTASARPPEQRIATIGTDPNRAIYGGRLLTEDAILRTRGQGRGLWLYDEIARDPAVATVLQKRRDALVSREWQVQAADESPAAADAAELVARALKRIAFNQAVEKLLDALLKGVSVLEVMWRVRGNELLPAALLHCDARRFGFRSREAEAAAAAADAARSWEPELRLLTKGSPLDGEAVPPRKFVVHRHGGLYEDPWGLGLGNRLFWPVYFKRQGIGFWLSALEKFGQPTVVGRYPAGTPETEQDKLLAALQAIASEAAVTIPEGMVAELLEAKRTGSFDSYERLARYMDEDIAKVVLGETLTTSAGEAGSRALGQVHNEVRLEITKSDADRLSDALNASLVPWIVDLNRPGYAATGLAYPRIWWDVSVPEDLAARAERDTKLRQLGYRPRPEYMAETYGDGWEPDQAPPPPPPGQAPGDALAALFAEAGRARRAPSLPPAADPRDAADLLAEQLDTIAAEAQERLVDAVRGVIENAESLDAARDALVRLMPALPVAQLAALLGQAMTVADLTGRADLQDGD